MAKDSQEKISLSPKIPKVTRLNRNTIMLISGILLIVIIFIFVSALSNSEPSANVPKSNIKPSVGSVLTPDMNTMNGLPSSYADATGINNLLNRNQPAKVVMQIPPELQSQITSLRDQQTQLQAQIASLKAQKAPPPPAPPQYSQSDQQAMTSSIFIAGGAPAPQPQNKQDQQDKDKKTTDASKSGSFTSTYDQQNNQAQKSGFLDSKPDKSIYNENQVQFPASPYIMQSGSTIPAILETEIVSNLPGLITAVVRRDVYDSVNGQYLLIPKGSRLIGEYNSTISYGQTQLQAVFTRLVRPDGTSIVLPGKTSGVNNMGVSGFSDQIDNHWMGVVGSAALTTLFNIPAALAQNQQSQGVGYNAQYGESGQYIGGGYSMASNAQTSALQAMGQSASQIGSTIAQKQLNIQPTITINAGYVFSVMVTKDIILPPYQTPMEIIPEIAS